MSHKQHVKYRIDLNSALPFLLATTVNAMSKIGLGLTVGGVRIGLREWRVIAYLGWRGEATAGEIALEHGVDKGTVSRAVDRLRKAGLVTVRGDAADSRKQWLSLTKRGAEVHDKIRVERRTYLEKIESALTDEELEDLRGKLRKMRASAMEVMAEMKRL